ncbi:hypothetical protein ASG32_02715 [Methylobacterium sp. Leaf361]|uniref:hypothetical protein n=1 Tax=Methylobacterium sp. Leaf361 TaxID=1736352 RepID=UPI0006F9A0EA|nr:hypothetical protein [Methylobacterium sp. Leaf361]KQS81680.1 hypothetical protein ASG32_02715 [Methylobacterium sp. Leaf361]
MKQIDLTGVVLDPAAGTLDFSGANIDPRTVLAVLHEPTNQFIYAVGRRGLGRKGINGQVLTLVFATAALSAGPITGFRDDGVDVATDARLEACRVLLATGSATLSNMATGLGTPSDAAPGSDAGAGSLIAKVTRLLLTQSGIASVLAAVRDRLPAALANGRLVVDGSGVVQPVTVGNFPATQPVSGTVNLGAGAAQIGTIGNAFALDATAQAGNTSTAAIAAATGTVADAATASGASTSVIGALRAIRDRLLGTLTVSGTVTAAQGAAGATAWKTDGSGVTQPISAASLPLPAGAATAANQTTGNASLSSIDGKFSASGTQTKAASRSVTPASDLANIEPAGAPITGTAMPAGGAGLTGWLSAIWRQLAARAMVYADATAVAVAANGTSGGAPRDSQSGGLVPWTRFNATFQSNQAGTAVIYGSNDGSTLVTLYNQAMTANTVYQTSMIVNFRYYYASIVNGPNAATVNVSTGFTTN